MEKSSKTLLLTGEQAYNSVKEYSKGFNVDVLKLPVSVAAFMTPGMVIKALKDKPNYSKAILPGLVNFDVSVLEKHFKTRFFKGPLYASCLPEILGEDVRLSKTKPYEGSSVGDAMKRIKNLPSGKTLFKIGGCKVTQNRPLIIAEIVDAPLLDSKQLLEKTEYYLDSGADMIDVGCIAGKDSSSKLPGIFSTLKKTGATLSIDSLNPKEIKAGVDAGAELVLSLDSSNLEMVDIPKETAVVVLPTDVSKGRIPCYSERTQALENNIQQARELGYTNILGDTVLDSMPNLLSSLTVYRDFREKNPEIPLFMGAGNVTELADVDSVGINAFLASIAVEIGFSCLLTTEQSSKTRKSVYELSQGLRMAMLAKHQNRPMKDLGIDLFVAKAKHDGEVISTDAKKAGKKTDANHAGKKTKFTPDPAGSFRISVEHGRKRITVIHSSGKAYYSDNAFDLITEVLPLISRIEHAAYMGKELYKAEMCLNSGKGYVQD